MLGRSTSLGSPSAPSVVPRPALPKRDDELVSRALLFATCCLLARLVSAHEDDGGALERGLPFSRRAGIEGLGEGASARVAIVASEFSGIVPNGGVGTFYTALAQELASAGHSVTLLYTQGTRSHSSVGDFDYWKGWYRDHGIDLLPVGFVPRYGSSYHASMSYEAFLKLRTLHEGDPFDVIHFPDWQGHGYYALLAKRLGLAFKDATLCVMIHGPLRWARFGNGEKLYDPSDIEVDFLERQTIKFADVLVSPSEYLIRWVKGQGWAVPEDSVHVQPYLTPKTGGPREGASTGQAEPKKSGIDEVVFFGRWEGRKGIKTFCDAVRGLARDLAETDPDDLGAERGPFNVTFMGSDRGMIGGMTSREYVTNCVNAWSDALPPGSTSPVSHVSLKNNLNSHQAHEYLGKANCVAVLPSLFENSPLSIFELIDMRVPFIASSAGGIPELIHPDSRNQAIFDAGSQDQLKKKLLNALGKSAEDLVVRGMYDPQTVKQQWVDWHTTQARKDEIRPDQCASGSDLGESEIDEDLLEPNVVGVDVASEAAMGAMVSTNVTEASLLSLCLILDGKAASNTATLESLVAQDLGGYDILLWDSGGAGEAFLEARGLVVTRRLDLEGHSLGRNHIAGIQNLCSQEARTTHVVFVRSGQVLMKSALGDLLEVAVHRELDIASSFMSLYAPAGAGALDGLIRLATTNTKGDTFSLKVPGLQTYPFVFLGGAVLPGLYQNTYGGPFLIARKEALVRFGGFEETLEDSGYSVWEFYCRLVSLGASMEIVPRGMYLAPTKEGYTRRRNDQNLARRVLSHYLGKLSERVQNDILSMNPQSIKEIADLA